MRRLTVISIIILFLFTYPKSVGNSANVEIDYKTEKNYETVKVTTYTVSENETDSEPTITASGFKVDSLNPRKHRIIAVSHDLKKKYKFGQKVRVTGIGKYDGVYTVRDLMHRRWKKKIDILINPDDKQTSFKRAKISAVKQRNEK
jgi:3D (Asp-Asp-Asp) domain-containing protein